jgi:hypothetical protein
MEEQWGRNPEEATGSARFLGLVRRACEKSGRKVVVLIDEYDKPLLETMEDPELNEEIRKGLKAFYGVLKTADPWLRFVLLTGVTKFSQVSVFSDLNQLRDISLDEAYAGVCGISERELTETFEPELRALAEKNRLSYDEALGGMRKRFDEYTLGFPNEEVRYGFLNSLLPCYLPGLPEGQCFSVTRFIKELQKGDVEAFMTRLRAFFSSIPYELNDKTERHYQAIFYVAFTLMGQYAGAEVRGAAGRADAVVTTEGTVYVFEFKLAGRGTAEDALRQIEEKGYLIPWTAGGKKLVKVGAVFDPATRTLGEWKAEAPVA